MKTNPLRMLAALVLAAAALVLAACGGGTVAVTPVAYAPVAYGVPGQCYYLSDPAEALALQAAGLCPVGWVPTLMPLAWHLRYASYYDNQAYYGRYVPAARRNTYITNVTVFESSHRSEISTAAKTAQWKGSDGKVVVGTSPKTFSTGRQPASPGKSFANGVQKGLTQQSAPKPAPKPAAPVRVGSGGGSFKSGRR